MIRGHQTIYTSVFPASVDTTTANQGKRNVLKDERDTALVYRYYYYVELKRLRFDDCLLYLEKEFFLKAGSITELITKNLPMLKGIIEKRPALNDLRQKYPLFTWLK